jgi:hypothetical protein
MGPMNARRLELYELLKPKLDEEPARALVLALHDDPENLATKDDLAGLEQRLEARFDVFENRMEARFAKQDAVLTRRMVTIMGAWTILVGSAFGWAAALLR